MIAWQWLIDMGLCMWMNNQVSLGLALRVKMNAMSVSGA